MSAKRSVTLWIIAVLFLLSAVACSTVEGPNAQATEPSLEVQGGSFSLGRGSLYAILGATGYGKTDGVVFTFEAAPTLVPIACNPSSTCSVYGQARNLLVETATKYGDAIPVKNGRTKALQTYVWTSGDLDGLKPQASDFANPSWKLGFDAYSLGCVVGTFTKGGSTFYQEAKWVTNDGGVRYLYRLTPSGDVVLDSAVVMGSFAYEDNANCTVE